MIRPKIKDALEKIKSTTDYRIVYDTFEIDIQGGREELFELPKEELRLVLKTFREINISKFGDDGETFMEFFTDDIISMLQTYLNMCSECEVEFEDKLTEGMCIGCHQIELEFEEDFKEQESWAIARGRT